MSAIFNQVEAFLLTFCPSPSPVLLALSGGADSLCLFYALLVFRERHGKPFHIAHVDHRWRQESQEEAEALRELALQHQVPFHVKILDPSLLKGNLEAACREERYAFFAELCREIYFQGVLIGHHQDDQAETIFKRMLEGSHWSRWGALQPESWIKGIRILRPLLEITKNEIRQALSGENIQAFEDPSNRHFEFLRARLRETLFPRLNQEFGKRVQPSLIAIGKDAQELVHYFDARLTPLIEQSSQGPWGICLDLQSFMPKSLLEIKYVLRLLCKRQNFFLSRDIIQQAAQALQLGKANQLFAMGSHQIWIDRQRIFLLTFPLVVKESQSIKIVAGSHSLGNWKLSVIESVYSAEESTSWQEGWEGWFKCYLPIGNYMIGFKKSLDPEILNRVAIKKRWSQAKVPAFLCNSFPLVWGKEGIYHEFLTGSPLFSLREGIPCFAIDLRHGKQTI